MKLTLPVAVTVLVLLPCITMAQAVAPPPQPLHLVGDHWTPYDPPADFPEGSQVHIIQRGDTLWDLAEAYLGDPYLWPQLWERNPYIKDSHWIYPGDPLVVDLAVQEPEPYVEDVAEEPVEVSEYDRGDEDAEPELEADPGMPLPLASSAEVYCFAMLVEDESIFSFAINSAEQIQYQDHYSTGDIVYVNGGVEQGVAAGDRFFVLTPSRDLKHPISNSGMGKVFRFIGQLKVLCAQENTSIAELTFSCDPISIGDVLLPFRPIPVPLVLDSDPTDRCDEPNGLPTGYVIYARDDVKEIGIGHAVMIDLSEADGLYPGQYATVFRDNPVQGMPRMVMGEVGILTVEATYATAVVTRAWSPVAVGDRVELK